MAKPQKKMEDQLKKVIDILGDIESNTDYIYSTKNELEDVQKEIKDLKNEVKELQTTLNVILDVLIDIRDKD